MGTRFQLSSEGPAGRRRSSCTFFVPAPTVEASARTVVICGRWTLRLLTPAASYKHSAGAGFAPGSLSPGRLQWYEFHVDWELPTCPDYPDQKSCRSRSTPATTSFSVSSSRLLHSLSYGYMMQRLTYRNFGPRQTLLLNHTVVTRITQVSVGTSCA